MGAELMLRPCPGCGHAYGEHSLDSLVECIEGLFECDDEEPPWPAPLVPRRPVEVVETDLL